MRHTEDVEETIMDHENEDQPVALDPDTLREVAKIMRSTIEDEVPVGPAMTGAFNVTASWAKWMDDQAAQIGARP